MSVIAFALARNSAVTIAITAVVTVVLCAGIVTIWLRTNGDPSVLDRRRQKVVTPTFILLVVSVVMNGIGLLGVSVVTTDTNRVVGFVRDQTSPARQEQLQEQQDGLLVQIDCNAASRLQRGFDALAEQGLIQPVDVTLGCGHILGGIATTTTP